MTHMLPTNLTLPLHKISLQLESPNEEKRRRRRSHKNSINQKKFILTNIIANRATPK
jgi:hypothetical protein